MDVKSFDLFEYFLVGSLRWYCRMFCDIFRSRRRIGDIVSVVMVSEWDCASGMPIQKPPSHQPEYTHHPHHNLSFSSNHALYPCSIKRREVLYPRSTKRREVLGPHTAERRDVFWNPSLRCPRHMRLVLGQILCFSNFGNPVNPDFRQNKSVHDIGNLGNTGNLGNHGNLGNLVINPLFHSAHFFTWPTISFSNFLTQTTFYSFSYSPLFHSSHFLLCHFSFCHCLSLFYSAPHFCSAHFLTRSTFSSIHFFTLPTISLCPLFHSAHFFTRPTISFRNFLTQPTFPIGPFFTWPYFSHSPLFHWAHFYLDYLDYHDYHDYPDYQD